MEAAIKKIVEIGTVSSRGQVAIPSNVRKKLELNDGEKILFAVEGDSLIIKKFNTEKTWEEVTKPLREAARKKGFNESDVEGIVHRFRKSKGK